MCQRCTLQIFPWSEATWAAERTAVATATMMPVVQWEFSPHSEKTQRPGPARVAVRWNCLCCDNSRFCTQQIYIPLRNMASLIKCTCWVKTVSMLCVLTFPSFLLYSLCSYIELYRSVTAWMYIQKSLWLAGRHSGRAWFRHQDRLRSSLEWQGQRRTAHLSYRST